MIDGFYRMTFTGTSGSGFGVVVFEGGVIAGADVAGGIFSGTYKEGATKGQVEFQISLTIPAGATPVQTGIPLTTSMTLPIEASLSESDIGSASPYLLQTPLGPVNVLFKKIRDVR
jgi:hypothetical protein